MEKEKVFITYYRKCEFNNLQEAVETILDQDGKLYVYLQSIIMHNIRFRDCLRKNGIDAVFQMLIDEAPIVAQHQKDLEMFKEQWLGSMEGIIADYDIRCLPKDSTIFIEGCRFDGLYDIMNQVEISDNPKHTYYRWSKHDNHKRNPDGLHVGEILESYPTFDSSDSSDGRTYDNYIFSREPITESMMEDYCRQVKANYNFCMVHENIPDHLLPIVYHNGDDEYMLVATSKQCNHSSTVQSSILQVWVEKLKAMLGFK